MDNGFNDEVFNNLDMNYFLDDHRNKDNHCNQGPSTNNMDSNMNSSLKNMSTLFTNAFDHNANHKAI
jgi:hypothetical protein